ncbi:MAG: VWA domain-containing protein [Synergistaceae bacterium]|nr:VWA domain-containing protein [Synergistaceae bacterium]MBQ6972779.1 VWA domain-containing protein [Synergistaceae bacterium]
MNETEIIFLIDRSGSMNVCEDDTIGGYNSFLEQQKKGRPGAFVTTVLFDNHYEIFCDHVSISEAAFLSEKEYFARGSTALLDAIGLTISRALSRQAEGGGASETLMVIITDGLDNSSKKYHIKTIFDMIHECEANGWEFIFLGADIDSVRTAQSIGISRDRAGSFTKDSAGIRGKFDGISRTVAHFRDTGKVSTDWRG